MRQHPTACAAVTLHPCASGWTVTRPVAFSAAASARASSTPSSTWPSAQVGEVSSPAHLSPRPRRLRWTAGEQTEFAAPVVEAVGGQRGGVAVVVLAQHRQQLAPPQPPQRVRARAASSRMKYDGPNSSAGVQAAVAHGGVDPIAQVAPSACRHARWPRTSARSTPCQRRLRRCPSEGTRTGGASRRRAARSSGRRCSSCR